jgi:Ca2+-binding RTX toxin-like protein
VNGYIQEVQFANGTKWSQVDLLAMISTTTNGTAAAETINGWGGIDLLNGLGGNDTLNGFAGNDLLDGGDGNDTLAGGTGNDTYILGRGYGSDTINENDGTANNADVAKFSSGIATKQLWFSRVGNNLDVSVIGTADKFTVQNWYLGTQYHVEQFRTTDGGKVLLDSQVNALVSAMAAFTPPAAGQTNLSQAMQDQLQPVLAASWH